MTLATLAKYLFLLDRQAIRDIAGCRQAVWLGLLFVLSAGFAREYDGEDLLAEPWHLLIPLAASLATSLLLFVFVWSTARGWDRELPFEESYRSFLGLYWMTAPLAWLYAIPVERFLSPAQAVEANLWLLAIVAAWRVVLMIQVVSTLLRISVVRAMFPVLLFADSLVVVILFLTPLPVFSFMGGIRLSESEQLIQGTAFLVGTLGILSWPIWLIGTTVMATKPAPSEESSTDTNPAAREPVSQTLWGLGILSLAIWILILPLTQPEQQRRRQVETLLRNGRIEGTLEFMSAHERQDFPPHWDPPPRIGYGETEPDLVDVMETLIAIEVKPWVSNLYWEKFQHLLGMPIVGTITGDTWMERSLTATWRYSRSCRKIRQSSPNTRRH
jgi:hypothetical protein